VHYFLKLAQLNLLLGKKVEQKLRSFSVAHFSVLLALALASSPEQDLRD
jgi:hypothetical protein